jgi:hypothetical protein
MAASPLDTILNEIEKALDAEFYYLAVTSALTLPDICAALQDENGNGGGENYKKWCTEWLKKSRLTPKDLWSLRCGLIHNGKLIGHHDGLEYSRVIFSATKCGGLHGIQIAGGHRMDPEAMLRDPREAVRAHGKNPMFLVSSEFCKEIIEAVRAWFAKHGESNIVKWNMSNLLLLRPTGLMPYVNYPVIT